MMGLVQMKRNDCLQLVRLSNRKVNEIRTGENEGKKHREVKESICKALRDEGKYFVTEAIFKNGGRADILVLDDFKVIEILDSESVESIRAKKGYYPKGLKVEVVKIGDISGSGD